MIEENVKSSPTEHELVDESTVRSLLARANLLRMRGQWNEAIAACTDALRHAPNSASAHSLLGDIYEAQGKHDDAAQWFGMALEIDPSNASDRAKWERVTQIQRIRLRTQDIAAQAATGKPAVQRERTLEWFDRIFPPSRSDSLPRLILAMSLTFAFLIAVCAGFIYFYITPHHEPMVATTSDSPTTEMPGDISLSASPVVMTPSAATRAGSAEGKVAATSTQAEATLEKSSEKGLPHASVTITPVATPFPTDATTLRARLTSQLNSTDMQVAGVSYGENGGLYLDLILSAGAASESTEHLRERALRAASQAAHALAGLLPTDSQQHDFIRIARLLPPTASMLGSSASARQKSFDMVFQAEAPLREFHNTEVATMTTSDLMGRFQNTLWYAAGTAPPTTAENGGATVTADTTTGAVPSTPAPSATNSSAPGTSGNPGGALATQ